jgi:hypothetical protein
MKREFAGGVAGADDEVGVAVGATTGCYREQNQRSVEQVVIRWWGRLLSGNGLGRRLRALVKTQLERSTQSLARNRQAIPLPARLTPD